MEILQPVLDLFARYSQILMMVALASIILSYIAQSRGNWRLLRKVSWVTLVIAVPFTILCVMTGQVLGAVIWGWNAFMSWKTVRR